MHIRRAPPGVPRRSPTYLRERKVCAHHAGPAHAVDLFCQHPQPSSSNLLIVIRPSWLTAGPSTGGAEIMLTIRSIKHSLVHSLAGDVARNYSLEVTGPVKQGRRLSMGVLVRSGPSWHPCCYP